MRAVFEVKRPNARGAFPNGQRDQTAALGEGILPGSAVAGGELQLCESGAAGKSVVGQMMEAVREMDLLQLRAVAEGIGTDGGQRLREDQLRQLRAALEQIGAQFCDAFFHNQTRDGAQI